MHRTLLVMDEPLEDVGYPFGFAAPRDAPSFEPPVGAAWLEPLQPSAGKPVGYQPSSDVVSPPLEKIAPAPETPRNPAEPFSRFNADDVSDVPPWDPHAPIPSADTWSATENSGGYADFAPPTGLPVAVSKPDHVMLPPIRQLDSHGTAPGAPVWNPGSIAAPSGVPGAPAWSQTMPSWNQRVASPQQPQLAPLAPQFPIQQNWWRIIGWPFFVVLAIGIFEPALAMLSLGLAFILSARITVGTQYVRKLFAGLMLSAFALWMANQAIISGVLDWDYTLPSTLFRLLCIIAAVGTPVAVYMAQTKQRQGY